MIWLLAMVACKIPAPDGVVDTSLRDDWFDAFCRLSVETGCQEDPSCGPHSLDLFSNRRECVQWQKFAYSDCDGLIAAFRDAEPDVRACIAELDAFDCDKAICDHDGVPVTERGECAAVTRMVDETCGPTGGPAR